MTEHTDKTADKSGKAAPGKRAGKARSPHGKRATAPGLPAAGDANPDSTRPGSTGLGAPGSAAPSMMSSPAPSSATPSSATPSPTASPSKPANPLAPDPATITFGSNRPIVASPPKLPESSGLRFSGPSAGELKASGPQPTSPKASGLTFSSAKSGNGKPAGTVAKPPASAIGAKPAANGVGASGKDKDAAKTPAGSAEAKVPGGKPGEAKKPDTKKTDTKKADAKTGVTKPAIAPQASGRHFDKERSTSGFLAMLVALTVVVGGLAFWMKLGNETPPQGNASVVQTATLPEPTVQAIPDTPAPAPAPVFGPSVRAPETPGPLASTAAESGDLSAAEIGEIQDLLSRLDFDPGSESGVMTAATSAAIRSYQEMAGLPTDGMANQALLEELRSVVELYGS